MRLTAFFKLYKICILLHRCNLKIFAKIGLKNQQFSWNFSKKIANVAKFAEICQISKISAWESGRFWKMLQNAYFLAKIGADTAENEQHFAEILPTDALWRRADLLPRAMMVDIRVRRWPASSCSVWQDLQQVLRTVPDFDPWFRETLVGSFSAVSKLFWATKY